MSYSRSGMDKYLHAIVSQPTTVEQLRFEYIPPPARSSSKPYHTIIKPPFYRRLPPSIKTVRRINPALPQ